MPFVIAQPEGLSPRLRGNRVDAPQRGAPARSIPAPAGEPPLHLRTTSPTGVYPRACGGTPLASGLSQCSSGLSPRLRGNRPGIRQRDCGQRSIPAPAGEPTSLMTCHSNGAVYPRACGGTMISMRTPSPPAGLSPRLRGNLEDYWALGLPKRSIPAPAGEPQHRKREAPLDRVYPRACGGTPPNLVGGLSRTGLSPRLRGNRP